MALWAKPNGVIAMILRESKDSVEYARRAEAWAATEAKRPTDIELVDMWNGMSDSMWKTKTYKKQHDRCTLAYFKAAKEARIAGRIFMWDSLIKEAI